jgi:hypothetical protein
MAQAERNTAAVRRALAMLRSWRSPAWEVVMVRPQRDAGEGRRGPLGREGSAASAARGPKHAMSR